jgi:hypothetical protein
MAAQETIYYDKGGVKITNVRAVMGTNTYPMNNITSVGIGTQSPRRGMPIILIAVSLLVLILSWGVYQGDPKTAGQLILGAVVGLLLGGAWLLTGVVIYFVRVGAAGGEQRAYLSRDKTEIESIVAALNEAIVKRG